MKPHHFGLRDHLLFIGLASVVPLVALTLLMTVELRAGAYTRFRGDVARDARLVSYADTATLERYREFLDAEIQVASSTAPGSRMGRVGLRRLLQRNRDFVEDGILWPGGKAVERAPGKAGSSDLGLWLLSKTSASTNHMMIAPIRSNSATGDQVIPIDMAVTDPRDHSRVLCFALADAGVIRKSWNVLFTPQTRYLGIKDGRVLMAGPNQAHLSGKSVSRVLGGDALHARTMLSSRPGGVSRLWYFEPIAGDRLLGSDLVLAVGVPRYAIYSPAEDLLYRVGIGIAAAAILLIALGLWVTEKRAIRPLSAVLRAITEVGRGNFGVRVSFVRNGSLAELVNRTAEALQRYEEEQDRMLDSLMESGRRYRSVVETTSDGILVVDRDLGIRLANRALAGLLKMPSSSELIGKTMTEIVSPRDHPLVFSADASGVLRMAAASAVEVEMIDADGNTVPVEISIAPPAQSNDAYSSTVVVARDVSERKKLEAERSVLQEAFHQAHKMESIGLLAGGVAHDFNNSLTVIQGYAELARASVGNSMALLDSLEQIERASLRAGDLTRQLLLFSRRESMDYSPLAIDDVVVGLSKMMSRIVGENVQLEVSADEKPWRVNADRGSLEQAIMNLVLNARDAMPDGGSISLVIDNRVIDERYCSTHPSGTPGRYVMVSVRDVGRGIPRDVLPRIFEPFFTTKAPGQGTGLGLSVVHGVVQQHDGWIEVNSTVGRGTVFEIYLPAAAESEREHDRSQWTSAKDHGTDMTILVVEDETPIRALLVRLLREHDYRVIAAQDIADAQRIYDAHGDKIDLLLTDVVLPDGSGELLYRAMKSLQPDLKVLFASGYGDDSPYRRAVEKGGYPFLPKPFDRSTLLESIGKAVADR